MIEKTTTRPPMPRVTLGRTGLETSRLSIGTWGFGTGSAPAAQQNDDQVLIDVLTAAFEAGVTFIDSAEAYDNEQRLGRLLSQVETPSDLIISTKFGHGRGFSADDFRRSAERSLAQLHLEQIPIMMVHDPRDDDDMDTILGPGGALEGLRKLQDEGLVAHIGVATATLSPLQRAVDTGEFDFLQIARLYTLLNPAAKTSGLLAAAREKGMAVCNASPFGGNILATGTANPHALYTYRPALPEVREAVQRMEARCEELGITIAEAAMSYSLTQPDIDVTIVGVTSTRELGWDLDALKVTTTRDEIESIARAGEIDPALLGGPTFRTAWPADRVPEN
ncbi:aldo/keto reductase [Microbacterium esteraromaticum]|uniref:Aldo/keto reductase n=1 Tax=Microbacterium esteraromaticum TaxID=57043 RepID=A0A7D8ACA8_9MICO|nr:aldo/keto reductase [Microbacterium esteraromaticum]QMU97164.1 aldo/keto reductase [Microbacterium esteraromaticum]